ncbi:major facilitator superfamily protein [Sarocladium implicatum]|nr:major facilitator superfamily protein [Sarocladium implicatum]
MGDNKDGPTADAGDGKDMELQKPDLVQEVVATPDEFRNLSEEELKTLEKKMVRKMDFVIMPIIGVLYILNYIDRQALAATRVYGIMEDLNMSEAQFATAISILFVGYLPFQIPSNMVMTIVPRPGLYLCIAATIWGVVSTCTAAVKSYEALLVVRVFLGVTEAVFFPGVIYYLSAWYPKQRLGKRLALLFVFQMVGNAFGGFVAAACLTLDGKHGIEGWRWLFIVEGVVTIGCGLLFAAVMPEYPHKARILKPIERKYAVWRLEREAGAGEATEEQSTLDSFKQAFLDPKIWALVWCMGMSQAMGSTNNFFPSIVQSLGYNKSNTMLLTAPPMVLAAICCYLVSWYSDRKDAILPIFCAALATAVVAYIIPLATVNTAGRYVAMMLMPSVVAIPQIMIYKTMNLHMARPYPKRAAGVAMINSIGGISNIWASYLYYDSPRYTAAFAGAIGFTGVFFLTLVIYRWHVLRLNKLLDGTPSEQARVLKKGVTQQQIDLGWRYIGF